MISLLPCVVKAEKLILNIYGFVPTSENVGFFFKIEGLMKMRVFQKCPDT